MVVKGRRLRARGWARGIFAVLWIVLAGFSGLYLFTLFTNPSALGGETVKLSALMRGDQPPAAAPAAPAPPAGPPASAVSAADVAKLNGSLDALSQKFAQLDARLKPIEKLNGSLDALSQKFAQLDARLKPIEKFVGPVAALPPATSVTTSPPEPVEPAAAAEPSPPTQPDEVAEVEEETEVVEATPEPPAPEPEPEAAPAEPEPAPAAETATPEAHGEIAALDPVTLPPAANDGSTRYGIEIGVVAKRDELRPLWREYLTKHAALVAGLQPRRVLAPDKKWRLIAGPFANAQDAEGACTLFKKADRPCAATVYAGDAL
jgi:hypothetical protein